MNQINSNKFVWFISMDGFKLSISMNQFNKSISKVSKELIHWNGQKLMCLIMSDSHLWFCIISVSLTLKDVVVKDSNWWLSCSIRSLIKVLPLMNGRLFGKIWQRPWGKPPAAARDTSCVINGQVQGLTSSEFWLWFVFCQSSSTWKTLWNCERESERLLIHDKTRLDCLFRVDEVKEALSD